MKDISEKKTQKNQIGLTNPANPPSRRRCGPVGADVETEGAEVRALDGEAEAGDVGPVEGLDPRHAAEPRGVRAGPRSRGGEGWGGGRVWGSEEGMGGGGKRRRGEYRGDEGVCGVWTVVCGWWCGVDGVVCGWCDVWMMMVVWMVDGGVGIPRHVTGLTVGEGGHRGGGGCGDWWGKHTRRPDAFLRGQGSRGGVRLSRG